MRPSRFRISAFNSSVLREGCGKKVIPMILRSVGITILRKAQTGSVIFILYPVYLYCTGSSGQTIIKAYLNNKQNTKL